MRSSASWLFLKKALIIASVRLVYFIVLVFGLTSCSSISSPEKSEASSEKLSEAVPEQQPALERYQTVGRIASVNQEEKFVLVQQYARTTLPEGSTLSSFGANGERSNLRVSGEKMGLFSVADIRSGTARVGDPVQVLIVIPQKGTAAVESPNSTEPDVNINSPEAQLVPKPEVSGNPDI